MSNMKSRGSVSTSPLTGSQQTSPDLNEISVTEASKMLEAALQQMDGIISGTTASTTTSVNSNGSTTAVSVRSTSMSLSEHNLISATNVLSTAKTLALALQQVGLAAPTPDSVTASIISDWLDMHIPRQDSDERLRRAQRERETLTQQFQDLTDKAAVQAQKIIDLERQLAERTRLLSSSEAALQRQMLSQSALETQKLELMSALSELKLHRAALERENVELKTTAAKGGGSIETDANSGDRGVVTTQHNTPFGSVGNLNQSAHALSISVPKTPPAALRHQIHPHFHSLPRSHLSKKPHKSLNLNNNNNNNRVYDANANASKRYVAFASNEKIIDDANVTQMNANISNDLMYSSFTSQLNSTPSPNLRERSTKGLRNIFGKLKRSNSGNLELPALEQVDNEFRRGGARATAGGRIEWSTQELHAVQSPKDYADWSPQEVCNWLCDLGLGCYEEQCKKWLKSDPNISFFNVSALEIERELHLKTPLHRKKIMLAMDELMGKEVDELTLKASELDVSWVLRWLDDIGLPQYKDSFLQAKIDGRMLHRLTLEDLTHLHVTSCLHIASLRCGIQCMRANSWNPECLVRRSTQRTNGSSNGAAEDEYEDEDDEEQNRTESIALWTAHRVMEWLRVVDLSEYAPNLRGAGVHGALMLFEPRFNADLLADLLSIPPSKTLLRRHLATHFKELLGRAVIHEKRDAEAAPGYQPLTIAAKIKVPKKAQFSLKRRKSTKGINESEWSEYVCPMATAMIASVTTTTITTSATTTTIPITTAITATTTIEQEDQTQNTSNASSTSTNNSSSINSN